MQLRVLFLNIEMSFLATDQYITAKSGKTFLKFFDTWSFNKFLEIIAEKFYFKILIENIIFIIEYK